MELLSQYSIIRQPKLPDCQYVYVVAPVEEGEEEEKGYTVEDLKDHVDQSIEDLKDHVDHVDQSIDEVKAQFQEQ